MRGYDPNLGHSPCSVSSSLKLLGSKNHSIGRPTLAVQQGGRIMRCDARSSWVECFPLSSFFCWPRSQPRSAQFAGDESQFSYFLYGGAGWGAEHKNRPPHGGFSCLKQERECGVGVDTVRRSFPPTNEKKEKNIREGWQAVQLPYPLPSELPSQFALVPPLHALILRSGRPTWHLLPPFHRPT